MTILVYDLGGGTFDVTIMKVAGPQELCVLTSGGDRFLGGADFDADLRRRSICPPTPRST